MRFLIALFTFSLWTTLMVGQTGNCGDPSPLCIMPSFDYPIANNIPIAPGDYGCIDRATNPNPLNGYFYTELRISGNIILDFTSQNTLSIAAWGPFPSLAAATLSCGSLPPPFSCDSNDNFSSESTTVNISGQVGDFFLIYVQGEAPPAYSGQFSVSQTNAGLPGAGSLACNGFNNVTIGCPQAINLSDCNDEIPEPIMSAFDFVNAGGNLDELCTDRIALTVEIAENGGLGCPGDPRFAERRYFFQDQCGNIGSCTQQITYPIIQGPLELFCPPSDAPSQLVTCLDDLEVNVQDIIAVDGCGIELSFDIGEPTINDASLGIECDLTCLHYPVTVTDECGRVGECTLSFTVFGNVPEFVNDIDETGLACRLAPLDIDCEDNMDNEIENWLDTLSVFSTCGNSTDLTTTFDQDNFVTVCDGDTAMTQEITITAKDDCGRTNSCTATINIIKTEGPRIAAEAKDKWVTCSQNVDSIFQAYLADNGGAIAIDFCTATTFTTNPADPQVFISCGDEPGLSIEFIATDICGNSASTVGVFKVMNDGDISLSTPASDAIVACGDDAGSAFMDFIDTQAGAQAVACGDVVWTTDPENPMLPTIDDDCNDASTTVTFTATDECGQQISTTATFSVEDNTAPAIAGGNNLDLICGMDTEMQIEAWLVSNGSLDITDECTNVTVTNDYQAIDLDNVCHDDPIIVTFTVTDACGNESTQTLEINIVDNTPPVFTFIPTTIDEEAIAEDECSDVIITTMDVTNGGQIIRTYTATDACGNSTSVTVTFGEIDNTPPVITFIPDEVGCDGVLNPDDIIATDDQGEVTITVSLISQTGSCDMGYTFVYEVSATDEAGNTTTETVTYDVPADNEPPVITDIPTNLTFMCSDEIIITEPTVTDNCEVVSLTCVETLNDGAVTDDCNNGYGYDITKVWTATDACGNTSTAVTLAWVVPDDYIGPRFEFVPEDAVMECGDNTTFGEAVCTTACGNLELTFKDEFLQGDCTLDGQMTRTWTGVDDCGNVATATQTITIPADTEAPVFTYVPESATIDNIEDMVFGTPNCIDNCATISHLDIDFVDTSLEGACGFVRTWIVSDLCGNTAQASQTFTIEDSEAPVIDETTDLIEANCGFEMGFTNPNIYDNMGEVDVTITDNQLANNCTGLPEFTRTWTATDRCGNVSSFTQTLRTVDTEAPTFETLLAEKVITCNDEFIFDQALAIDACTNIERLTFEDEILTDVSCEGCTDITRRTWTAVDACGNEAQAIQTLIVRDQVAPLLTLANGSEIELSCGEELNIEEPTATDDCSQVELSFTDTSLSDGCTTGLSFMRTWTATDWVGNQSQISQTYIFLDNEAPVFTEVPSSIELSCNDSFEFIAPEATDACSGLVSLIHTDEFLTTDCGADMKAIRTWTATDECGNAISFSQTIEIVDHTAPVISGAPEDIVLACGEEIPEVPSFVVAIDDCDQNVNILFEEAFVDGDNCSESSVLIRTWTAFDDCGNESSASQKIEMTLDILAPVLESPLSEKLWIDCGDELTFETPIFLDNCSEVELNYSDDVQTFICETVYERTWVANDACGNATEIKQTIIEVDTHAPEFVAEPANIEMTYSEFLAWTPPSLLDATDNCSEITQLMTSDANQDCANYVVSYHYDLTDNCGNNTQTSFDVLVLDAMPSFELSTVSDVVCGETIIIDVLALSSQNLDLSWTLADPSETWDIVNITEGQIEILAGEETAELTLTVENQLGCAVIKTQTLECSLVSSVQDLIAVSELNLSPNPVSQMLNINLISNKSLSANINVYDLLGRTIYQSAEEINLGQNQFDINATNFENGTYILEIATEQGSKIEKFVKF